jgi:hypothetical protein
MTSQIIAAVGARSAAELIQGVADYMSTLESEKTKRQEIWAHHDAIVHALNEERDIILAYFNHVFAERRLVIEQCFVVIDKSISTNDHEGLSMALSAILGVIHDNPLKDLDTFKQRMSEPGVKIVL